MTPAGAGLEAEPVGTGETEGLAASCAGADDISFQPGADLPDRVGGEGAEGVAFGGFEVGVEGQRSRALRGGESGSGGKRGRAEG